MNTTKRTVSSRNIPVRDIMTSPPLTVDEQTPVDRVFDQMAKAKIGAMLVTRNGALTGIISERDCLRLWNANCGHKPVREFMTPNPTSITEEVTGDAAYDIMDRGGFRHMPVLRGSELVGMVSLRDVARLRTEELETEKDHLATLMGVARTVSRSIDVKDILKEIVKYVQHLLRAERASVLLLGKDRRFFQVLQAEAASGGTDIFERFELADFPALKNLFSNEIRIYGKTDDDLFALLTRVMNIPADCRIIVIPIMVKDESHGLIVAALALSLGTSEGWGSSMPPDIHEICQAVASETGYAISNSQMYDDLRTAYDELKRAEETKEKTSELQRMASLGQLAGGVAHEINNALTGILGMAELIRRGQSGNDEIDIIIQEGRRASKVAQDLLTFARPAAPNAQNVDVPDLIRNVLKIAANDLMIHRVNANLRAPEGIPAVIADEPQIHQVFLNLILNARDAMPGGGFIDIGIRPDGEFLRVDFTDTGPGIPAHILPRIFDPFFTTKERGKGTGLGLSICLGIIQAQNGSIEAANRTEGGARFTVRLPLSKGSAEEAKAKPGLPAAGTPKGLKILIVDDDRTVLDVCGRILQKSGNEVVLADGPMEALRQMEGLVFDVVICDQTMPKNSGLDFHEMLRQRRRTEANHFILMTGRSKEEMSGDVPAFVELLLKPIDFEDLLKLVAQTAGRRRPAG